MAVRVGLADKEARRRSAWVKQKRCVLLLMHDLFSIFINSGHVESLLLLRNLLLHGIDTRSLWHADCEARCVTVLLVRLDDLLPDLVYKVFVVSLIN